MIAMCGLAWNCADHSKRWLDSVRRNTPGHDVKLFLLDNGSTDNTSELFKSYNPEVFIRHQNNDSIHIAWNKLLREAAARGPELIVLSNNDLIVGPGWADAALRELRKNPKRYFLPNGDVGSFDTFDNDVRAALPSLPQSTTPARAGWFLMFPPDALPIFLPVPEELILWYGDDYIHTKLQAAGYTCESIQDCCVKHLVSVTVFRRPGYTEIVEKDRQIYQEIMRKQP